MSSARAAATSECPDEPLSNPTRALGRAGSPDSDVSIRCVAGFTTALGSTVKANPA